MHSEKDVILAVSVRMKLLYFSNLSLLHIFYADVGRPYIPKKKLIISFILKINIHILTPWISIIDAGKEYSFLDHVTMISKGIEESNGYVHYTWGSIDKIKQLLSNQ